MMSLVSVALSPLVVVHVPEHQHEHHVPLGRASTPGGKSGEHLDEEEQ